MTNSLTSLYRYFFAELSDEELKPFAKRTAAHYRWYRTFFFRFWQRLVWWYMCLFRDAKVTGRENVPKDRDNFILVSNHVSNLDPFVVGSVVPKVKTAFMAKKELFQAPGTRWFMDGSGTFMVNRDKLEIATIRSAKEIIKTKGWALGIFPEGTRNKDGKKAEPKKGAAFIAKATGADILPFGVVYTPEGKVRVHVGDIIKNTGQDIEPFTHAIDTAIERLKNQ